MTGWQIVGVVILAVTLLGGLGWALVRDPVVVYALAISIAVVAVVMGAAFLATGALKP